jgi:ATP-dependent Clp endopeptidase proteolytic subunit ClpP
MGDQNLDVNPALVAATNERLQAEARKLQAETDEMAARQQRDAEKSQLEKEKLTVEIQKVKMEITNIEAVADAQRFQAEVFGINAEREREKRRWELASNIYYHVYTFTDVVTEDSVERCMGSLTTWTRTADPGKPKPKLEIIFTSPGGTLIPGMALFDYIQQIRRQGFSVTTGALGMAASMAGVLLQAGELRYMSKESWLLIHEAQFGAMGKMGEVQDIVEWIKKVQEHILDIFAERANVSKAWIRQHWNRKDWWLSAAEALKLGFIDEVR